MKTNLLLLLLINVFQSFGQISNNGIHLDTSSTNIPYKLDKTSLSLESDSSFQKFSKSIFDIQPLKNPIENLSINKDSIIKSKHFIPGVSGLLSVGYEYGLLTGYVDPNSTAPLNVFNSTGDFSIEALGLPVNLSYNYSTFRNPLGVNNYFRCSVDTDKLRENVKEKKSQAIGSIDKNIGEIQSGKNSIKGKLGMGEVLLQKYKREMSTNSERMSSYDLKIKEKTKSISEKELDSNNISLSDQKENQELDSLKKLYEKANEKYQKAVQLYDTVNKIYTKAMDIYSTYSNWQDQLTEKKSQIQELSDLKSNSNISSKANEKKEGFINSLQALDFGLTYPKSTGLSKNSIPIQGINIEFQKENWYLAFSSGVTLNNLMVSTDAIQNKLNNTSNLFNQFDFQNIQERGWLTNIKTGYGKPEETHFFVGFRYLTNSISSSVSDSITIPSLGNEIDIRWVPTFSKGTKIDLIYGKTSHRGALLDSTRSNVFNSLFSSDRTNTALVSISQDLSKIRTVLQTSVRWIDPYADVRSLGILQPDNLRYEFRTTTSLAHGIRLGLNFRQDQNNLMSIKDSTIHLNVVGGQLNGTILKSMSYFASVNYLTQSTSYLSAVSKKNNYMFGLGISSSYDIGKVKNSISISYNDYLITDSSSTGLFRNISLQQISKFNVGINRFSLGYFQMQDDLLQDNSSFIIGNDFSIQRNRYRILVGVKLALSDKYKTEPGGRMEFSYNLTKNIEWTLIVEKMVLGDFYNYYSRDRFDRFPYAIMTRINFILK